METARRKGIRVRIILRITVFLFLLTSVAFSQPEGGVTIASRPSGCTVHILGEIELVTTTPATITEQLRGTYLVSATRPGYETWTQEVVFSPGTLRKLTIELSPRTRMKAALRSRVIPGWGQYYSGEKSRSALWGVAIASSGVVAGIYELRYRDRKSDWEDGLERFDLAETIGEKELLQDEVYALQDRAYDAESDRRLAWGIVAGVWAINVLDALIFFPEEKKLIGIPLTVQPTRDGHGSLATFTFTF